MGAQRAAKASFRRGKNLMPAKNIQHRLTCLSFLDTIHGWRPCRRTRLRAGRGQCAVQGGMAHARSGRCVRYFACISSGQVSHQCRVLHELATVLLVSCLILQSTQ
jgi:hypothetical protein